MIGILLFTVISALFVFLAGRGDQARDPRLTVAVLVLLALFPLSVFLPKTEILPAAELGSSISRFPWHRLILSLWAMGFLVASIRLISAARGIARWRRNSTGVGTAGGVEIRQLEGLAGPVAAGVFRPVIFVPGNWMEWSVATRRMVLAHELAHHRRRDPLWRWIAEIAVAVHGCNPLVIWISRRMTLQFEFACDAHVLGAGVDRRDYARLLCDFSQARVPSGPVLAVASISTLESRVRRLVKPQASRGSASVLFLIALTMAVAGALAAFGPVSRNGSASESAEDVDLRWSANPFPSGE